jgi:predicted lipoprotein
MGCCISELLPRQVDENGVASAAHLPSKAQLWTQEYCGEVQTELKKVLPYATMQPGDVIEIQSKASEPGTGSEPATCQAKLSRLLSRGFLLCSTGSSPPLR